MARSDSMGEWSSPTREVRGSQLIRLVEESRQEEAAVAVIHDEPTRKCPAATLELLERSRHDSKPVQAPWLESSLAIPIEHDPLAEGSNPKLASEDARFASEIEVEALLEQLPIGPSPSKVRKRTGRFVMLWVCLLGVLMLLGASVVSSI